MNIPSEKGLELQEKLEGVLFIDTFTFSVITGSPSLSIKVIFRSVSHRGLLSLTLPVQLYPATVVPLQASQ